MLSAREQHAVQEVPILRTGGASDTPMTADTAQR